MRTLQVLCVLGASRCSLVEFVIWALIFLIFKANLYYKRVIFQMNFKILLRINNLAHQFETPTTFKSMRECNLWSLGMLRPHLRLKLKNSIEGRQRTVHRTNPTNIPKTMFTINYRTSPLSHSSLASLPSWSLFPKPFYTLKREGGIIIHPTWLLKS